MFYSIVYTSYGTSNSIKQKMEEHIWLFVRIQFIGEIWTYKILKLFVYLQTKKWQVQCIYLRSLVKPTNIQCYGRYKYSVGEKQFSNTSLDGFCTNHSLQATAETRMYEANLSDQLICEKTSHSSDAVRNYTRTRLYFKNNLLLMQYRVSSGNILITKMMKLLWSLALVLPIKRFARDVSLLT